MLAALALILPVSTPAVVLGRTNAGATGGGVAHADEFRDRQRAVIDTLDLPEAWRITRGKGMTVGLIDTGVNTEHRDLKGSVTTGPNFLSEVDKGTRPRRLHGTIMASLIAGHGHGRDGGDGVIGVAPEAKVLAVRALPDKEDDNFTVAQEADSEATSRAIRYVTDQGVDVINMSFGGEGADSDQRRAIAYAMDKGIPIVAAVGNEGDKKNKLDKDGFAPYIYPASHPGVIGVAASTPRHTRAAFSNRNYSVLVTAPGDQILGAGGKNDYYLGGGTSQATALVSGIVTLIRARHPKLAPALVAQALVASTGVRPGGGYNAELGYGEVNAARALREADRLAGYAPAGTGLSDAQRFTGSEPAPIKVIDRPAWTTVVGSTVIMVSIGCALAALIVSGLLRRRQRV